MSLSQDGPVEKTGMTPDRIKFPAGYRGFDDPKSFYRECGRPCWQSKWPVELITDALGLATSLSEEWGGNLLRLLATPPARTRRHTKKASGPEGNWPFRKFDYCTPEPRVRPMGLRLRSQEYPDQAEASPDRRGSAAFPPGCGLR